MIEEGVIILEKIFLEKVGVWSSGRVYIILFFRFVFERGGGIVRVWK